MENEIIYINMDDIIPNRFQPREIFDEKALNELADSIKQHGVIQPIVVRPVSNKYEIIVGERRYKASILAGLTKIPAIVKEMDDKESSIVAFIENSHRRDVSSIEEAKTIDRILKSNNMSQDELAKSLGMSQSSLANKLRLLALPLEVQEALMKNEISERHARSLLTVKDAQKQIELLNKIKEKRMTVRELDGEIKTMYNNDNTNNTFLNMNQYPSENSFLNNSQPTQNNGDFTNYLNNYDNNTNSNENNNEFMNFLNSYDNKSAPVDNNENNDSFMNYLNNYDTSVQESTPNNSDFANFLNNYDNNLESTDNGKKEDNNFMNYLNNYDTNVQEPTPNNNDFASYLNNYDNNNPLPVDNQNNEESNINNFLNNYSNNLASINNSVNPPITSNFNANSYIEENPNFVDVSEKPVMNNVDDIIEELKKTINKIKSESKFKVDTDEINFDDTYQITIKIDKRDF